MNKIDLNKFVFVVLMLLADILPSTATEFTEHSFLIAEGNSSNVNNQRFWNFLKSNNFSGIETVLEIRDNSVYVNNSDTEFSKLLDQIDEVTRADSTKIIPVFIEFDGDINSLDSIIENSSLSAFTFYLPQGETWPSLEYLIKANRRVLFFITGEYHNSSKIMHPLKNYVLQVLVPEVSRSADTYPSKKNITAELLMVNDFDKLPTQLLPTSSARNLIPDYINYLLETWTSFGKRPNFIFVGENFLNFDFIIEQLRSFAWINGVVKVAEKTIDKVYWRNPDVSVTGGKFSFPYRGGEEITLSPFAPGYQMTPEHIVVTGEMDIPESYTIIAVPKQLSSGLTGSFNFQGIILNSAQPSMVFQGENFSFSQDIERGGVMRLPEDASVNLGSPENFGLRNSSFTVSCFVKFTEILEYGDNAVLGNYESGYRRGLHLILRSGHPYFGLWANDFISEEKLEPNIWYHLAWRYILETGEQAIFLNGKNIGSSEGHPPFSGTGDIHLGSALSQGASLRGYIDDLYIWNRPLGSEEINRLALDEQIIIDKPDVSNTILERLWLKILAAFIVFSGLVFTFIFLVRKIRRKKPELSVSVPDLLADNQIRLYGKFKAIDSTGNDVTHQFTPKIKELFLYILLYTLKNSAGVNTTDIDEDLWPGLPPKKIANNRAVTLNKLRKILTRFEGIEIVTQNSFLAAEINQPFFCDYVEAFKLCQVPGGMNRQQLEAFFVLVKKGRFLKGLNWQWLDEMRGFTGNQVIDNLLHLAGDYKKENRIEDVDAIAKRILEYDDLNEEAIFLEIWALRKTKNLHVAKFNFESFRTKYRDIQGVDYKMSFDEFTTYYSAQF